MTDIKLILCDIDGCVGGQIYEWEPLALIRKYCERVQRNSSLPVFAFATGRSSEYVDCLVRVLNAFTPENIPSLVENGTFLFRPMGRITIPHPSLKGKEYVVTAAKTCLAKMVESGRARFIPGKEASVSMKPVDNTTSIEQLEDDVRSTLSPALLTELFVTHSTTAVDITVRGVDKGSGLHFLCQTIGIHPENVLAIGDTEGDLPILSAVGFPACPTNSSKEVKRRVQANANGYVAQASEAWGVLEIMKFHGL